MELYEEVEEERDRGGRRVIKNKTRDKKKRRNRE
jgi:hypothetical protein